MREMRKRHIGSVLYLPVAGCWGGGGEGERRGINILTVSLCNEYKKPRHFLYASPCPMSNVPTVAQIDWPRGRWLCFFDRNNRGGGELSILPY